MFIFSNCCWEPLMLLGGLAKGGQVNQTALKWKSSGIRNVRNTIIHNDKTDWRMECQQIKCDTDQWHSAELMSLSSLSRNDGLRSEFQEFSVYDSGPAFKEASCILTSGNELISLPLAWFQHKELAKIEEQRRKDLSLAQVQNEGHRHTLQTHTQNKEQILRKTSEVTFVKNIYIAKFFFLFYDNDIHKTLILNNKETKKKKINK